MIKGFVLNVDLLKNAVQGDYFDGLRARIRDIRSLNIALNHEISANSIS